MEKLQLWAGPRLLVVQGSSQWAGMSRPVGWAAACRALACSWLEHLDALVKKAKVVVFLEGTPERPQCGFSSALLQILRRLSLQRVDHPQLRRGFKDYSNRPTGPQVHLHGEFVRGSDILLQMHQIGGLVEEPKKLGIHSAL